MKFVTRTSDVDSTVLETAGQRRRGSNLRGNRFPQDGDRLQHLQRVIHRSPMMVAQRKLADTMTSSVAQRIHHGKEFEGPFAVQRRLEEEEEPMQPKLSVPSLSRSMTPGSSAVSPARRRPNTTGMPDEVKAQMETTFQEDFSDVRIHPQSSAAPAVQALAYTRGNEIHFTPGQFRPETASGRHLLGHELTHVIQQRDGRVRPTTEIGGVPVNDDPALEKEADARGRAAAGL